MFPPLAVIGAMEWEHWLNGDLISHRMMRPQCVVLGGFALAVVVALIWGTHLVYESVALGLLLASPILGGITCAYMEFRKRHPVAIFLTLVATMSLFASLAYWRAAPVVDDYHSSRDLSQLILPRISLKEPLILYRYFHHTALYYTRYQVAQEFPSGLKELQNYFRKNPQDRYYILTKEHGWSEVQSLDYNLIRHQGNLYLIEVASPISRDRLGQGLKKRAPKRVS